MGSLLIKTDPHSCIMYTGPDLMKSAAAATNALLVHSVRYYSYVMSVPNVRKQKMSTTTRFQSTMPFLLADKQEGSIKVDQDGSIIAVENARARTESNNHECGKRLFIRKRQRG